MATTRMLHKLVGSSVDDEPLEQCDLSRSADTSADISEKRIIVSGEGGQLFEYFIMDQIVKKESNFAKFFGSTPEKTPKLSTDLYNTASRLCDLASEFAESEERKKVKEAAMTVSPHMMRQELVIALQSMLEEATSLDDGILVLFYFCFDLSVRMLEANVHPCLWDAIVYVKVALDTVLVPYVKSQGGWGNFGDSAAKIVAGGLDSVFLKFRDLITT